MMDADYTDQQALLANALAETDSLLHSLEQPKGCIGFNWVQMKQNRCDLNKNETSTL